MARCDLGGRGPRRDPALAITDITTLDAVVSQSIGQPRFFALLLASFATLALVLAAVGIYGVLAFAVRQRTRAIGIRTTLGESRTQTLSLIIRQGMGPVAAGLGVGLVGAIALTRFLQRLLFDLEPLDPLTYVSVIVLLGIVSLAACIIPGHRLPGSTPWRRSAMSELRLRLYRPCIASYSAKGCRRGLFCGVGLFDPLAWTGTILTLLGVAVAAAWVPARRAGRAAPRDALRFE